jgi:hypothetical protein
MPKTKKRVIKKSSSKGKPTLRKSRKKELSLDNLEFSSYGEIKEQIKTKIGKMPSLPKGLPESVVGSCFGRGSLGQKQKRDQNSSKRILQTFC